QDGPDHVDAHRSVALVAGPYVKQGAVVSDSYTTVSMVRTIEEVLGLEPLGLTDGLAAPMTEVFERRRRPADWAYPPIVPEVLRSTMLPVPGTSVRRHFAPVTHPEHTAEHWEAVMAGQNFDREDAVDAAQFNRVLWRGEKGAGVPYPTVRHGRDLSSNR